MNGMAVPATGGALDTSRDDTMLPAGSVDVPMTGDDDGSSVLSSCPPGVLEEGPVEDW